MLEKGRNKYERNYMEEEKKVDVNPADETASESPAEKKDSEVKEDVKIHEKKAEELLSGSEKRILVDKERFNERNEKAKLFETHAPLLEKVLKDPELVERLLDENQGNDLEGRLARLEEERKAEKRNDIRGAVSEALARWPDFEKSWSDIQPIADSLSKKYTYKESLNRAYLAIHPEATAAEAERLANEAGNKAGMFSGGGSYSSNPSKINPETKLTEADKRNAKSLGKTEQEYAKTLDKWKGYGAEHGWDKV